MTFTDKTIEINSLESGKSNDSRLVLNITRMTIHNGPGMRTLVLFKGCPLQVPVVLDTGVAEDQAGNRCLSGQMHPMRGLHTGLPRQCDSSHRQKTGN